MGQWELIIRAWEPHTKSNSLHLSPFSFLVIHWQSLKQIILKFYKGIHMNSHFLSCVSLMWHTDGRWKIAQKYRVHSIKSTPTPHTDTQRTPSLPHPPPSAPWWIGAAGNIKPIILRVNYDRQDFILYSQIVFANKYHTSYEVGTLVLIFCCRLVHRSRYVDSEQMWPCVCW
jgi:hypothetical protein